MYIYINKETFPKNVTLTRLSKQTKAYKMLQNFLHYF